MNPTQQQQQSAEDRLRKIAESGGMTLRDFRELFNKAYIDDEKIRARLLEQQNQEMQFMQNQLAILQYRNANMENKLLTYKLERKAKWIELKKKVRGWFGRKPKDPKADAPVNTKPAVK